MVEIPVSSGLQRSRFWHYSTNDSTRSDLYRRIADVPARRARSVGMARGGPSVLLVKVAASVLAVTTVTIGLLLIVFGKRPDRTLLVLIVRNSRICSAHESTVDSDRCGGDVAKGIDVQSRKNAVKAEAMRQRASTLRVFIKDRYEPWAASYLRTWKFQIKRIKSDFESWLDRPLGSIDTALVEKWRAERLAAGNQRVTINRNLQRLHALMT